MWVEEKLFNDKKKGFSFFNPRKRISWALVSLNTKYKDVTYPKRVKWNLVFYRFMVSRAKAGKAH